MRQATESVNAAIHHLTYQVGNIATSKDWEGKAIILEQDGVRIAVPIDQVRRLIDALAMSASETAGATVGDEVVFV